MKFAISTKAVRYLPATTLAALMVPAAVAQMPASNQPTSSADAITAEPIVPQNPADMPAKPPVVTCTRGQLSIKADNATLASILAALQPCVGTKIESPDSAGSMRMFLNLGPGSQVDVLDELLSSTEFDYMIQAGETERGNVRSVVLLARTKPGDDIHDAREIERPEFSSLSATRRAWLDSRRAVRASREGTEAAPATDEDQPALSNTSADATASAANNTAASSDPKQQGDGPTTAATTPGEPIPVGADAMATVQPAQDASAPPPNTAITPANQSATTPSSGGDVQDKITNMQQLFEQRKQMMQNQAAPPKSPQ